MGCVYTYKDKEYDEDEFRALLSRLSPAEAAPFVPGVVGVPDAPFKKTEEWVGLVMKRLIEEAVRTGADRIAWTTGAQQTERFDLSKHVDHLIYNPKTNEFDALRVGGEVVHSGVYDPKALPSVIGKEAAERLLRSPLRPYYKAMTAATDDKWGSLNDEPVHALSGNDLKVGGSGMRAFYDEMIPSWVRDYGKKMGVKLDVTPVRLFTPDAGNITSIDRMEAIWRRTDLSRDARDVLHEIDAEMRGSDVDLDTAASTVLHNQPPAEAVEREVVAALRASDGMEPADPGENQSLKITPELRAKVEKEGQFVMERGKKYRATHDADQLDAFTVSIDNGPPQPMASQPKEADVALTKAQRATVKRVIAKVRDAGLPDAGERRAELDAAAEMDLIDPIGRDMSKPEDAASLMYAFRHPSVEIFHAFARSGGKVVGHLMVSSGMLNTSFLPDAQRIVDLARATDADDVVFGHNHPSGDPLPSTDDYVATHVLMGDLHEEGVTVGGHVIINHDHAYFFTLDTEKNEAHSTEVSIPKRARLAAKAPWQTAIQRGEMVVQSPERAASYMAAVSEPGAAIALFLDAQHRTVAVAPILPHGLATIEKWLPDAMESYGAMHVIMGVSVDQDPTAFAEKVGAAQNRLRPKVSVFDKTGASDWSAHIIDVLGLTPGSQQGVSYAGRGYVSVVDREGSDAEGVDRTVDLRPGAPALRQIAEGRRRAAAAGETGRLPDSNRIGERDLFGNESEDEESQSSLFGGSEGTAQSRSLKQTEAAARAELETLREKERLATSPTDKLRHARRIAELEKLLNRDEAISADELRTRAKAGDGDLFGRVSGRKPPAYTATGPIHPMPDPIDAERSKIRPQQLVDDLRRVMFPEAFNPEAKGTAGTIRHTEAIRFRRFAQINDTLSALEKAVEKLPRREQVEIWDAAESGKPLGVKWLDDMIDTFHKLTETVTDDLVARGELDANHAIAFYIGRYWAARNPPAKVVDFLRTRLGKRPFEGPKSFLKHRSNEFFVEGLDAGLIPATYNFVTSQKAKLAEMLRLIAAHDELATELAAGRAKRVMTHQDPPVDPDGRRWVKVDPAENDPAFVIFGPRHGAVKLPPESFTMKYDPADPTDPGTIDELKPGDVRVFGRRIMGHWYVPQTSAGIWRNFLSRGLHGKAWYDALTAPGNAAAQIILGISGFHATVIATEGMFSEMALAMAHAAEGRVGEVAKDAARIVTNPAGTFISSFLPPKKAAAARRQLAYGAKVLDEYMNPGAQPHLTSIVDAALKGGYRLTAQNEYWTGQRKDALRKALKDALTSNSKVRRAWGASRIPLDAVFAGIELAAQPILAHYVPLMKAAATMRAVAKRLEELPPSASEEAIQREMWDIVKEMDQRFGQVVYDNYFMHNIVKHLAQAMFLAPGWTFGTLALGGRFTRDFAMVPKRLSDRATGGGGGGKKGGGGAGAGAAGATPGKGGDVPKPILGRSGKYAVAMVVGTMLINGLITYFMTGDEPGAGDDGWKDFFAFRDGTFDGDGNAQRHTIPGYLMHDYYSWPTHPVKTFLNKLTPFFAFSSRLVRNETYYGDFIYDPDADLRTKGKQIGKEAASELGTPLSYQNLKEGLNREEGFGGEAARNLFGVNPAKREFVRTPAQNKMMDYLSRHGHKQRTPDQVEEGDAVRDALSGLRSGSPATGERLVRAITLGQLGDRQVNALMKRAGLLPLEERFKSLTAEEALDVFQRGTQFERAVFADLLSAKLDHKAKLNP